VIGEDHPLYGLHEPEDDDERIASVDERVNEYARLIRETQPEGPYNLIGWCASGAITVEIARKLQELGGKVAMVGLIDAAHPRYLNQMLSERANANHVDRFQEWRDYHLQRFERFERVGRIRYFAGAFRQMAIDRTRRVILHYGDPLFRLCARVGIKIPRFVDHLASVRIENPQPYPGKITLFRALETNRAHRDPTLGWRDLAVEGVDVVWTPGNHETMFIERNVEEFGRLVEEAMDGRLIETKIAEPQLVPIRRASHAYIS
jgi:thioesterase domain-containing protein